MQTKTSFSPFDTPQVEDSQSEAIAQSKKQEIKNVFSRVFNTPDGKVVLDFLDAMMAQEDASIPYSAINLSECLSAQHGRRLLVKTLHQLKDATPKGQ